MLMRQVTVTKTKVVDGPFGPRTIQERITEDRPITVPTRWECYSGTGGDRRIAGYARTFLGKVEKILQTPATNAQKKARIFNAAVAFYASWSRFADSETGSVTGAGDTEPRNAVAGFIDRVAGATGLWTDVFDLWDHVQTEAFQKKARKVS